MSLYLEDLKARMHSRIRFDSLEYSSLRKKFRIGYMEFEDIYDFQ